MTTKRIARTSARLLVREGRDGVGETFAYFELHQPGACISPGELFGALRQLGEPAADDPSISFRGWAGMSGCKSFTLIRKGWKTCGGQLYFVPRRLASLYTSMYEKLNAGAEGDIPLMLLLLERAGIEEIPVRLLDEEAVFVHDCLKFEEKKWGALRVRIKTLVAPDGTVVGEEVDRVEIISASPSPAEPTLVATNIWALTWWEAEQLKELPAGPPLGSVWWTDSVPEQTTEAFLCLERAEEEGWTVKICPC